MTSDVPRVHLILLGSVRGPASEGPRIGKELSRLDPGGVALALPPEEVRGLQEHFMEGGSEPLVLLSPAEEAMARALARFEVVRVPAPGFVEALRWATDRGRPVRGVDPGEDRYAEMFVENIRYLDLLRRTLAERSLVRSPPALGSPGELVRAWEGRLSRSRGSRRLTRARDEELEGNLRRFIQGLSPRPLRMVLLADEERRATLGAHLRRSGWDLQGDTAPLPGA